MISASIILGSTYQFRVRAYNQQGWGSYSDTLSVVSTTVTSTPDAPVVSLNNLNVMIKWTAPSTTNFASVTAYKITIADSTGTYIEDTTYCNGADS